MKSMINAALLTLFSTLAHAQCKIDYSQYHLILDEQFNGTKDDLATRWFFTDAGADPNSGYGTEIYDPSQVSILPGGICRLTATKLTNPYQVPRGNGEMRNVKYVSGTLRSKLTPDNGCWAENKGFTYGIFEMRAKLPAGTSGVSDVWPTFWLYSGPTEIDVMDDITDHTATEWRSGMIDWKKWPDQNTSDWTYISDCVACSDLDFSCDKSYVANQYVKYGGKRYRSNRSTTRVCCGMDAQKKNGDLSQAYNVYTVAWTPEKVTFFFNGREVYTISSSIIATYQCAADIRASLQMMEPGGLQEAYMDIDYIRVWKPNNGNYTTTPFKTALGWVNTPFFASNLASTPISTYSNYYNCIALNHFDENEFFYVGADQKIYRRKEGPGVPLSHFNISGTEYTSSGISFNNKWGLILYRDFTGTIRFINSWSDGSFHTNFFNATNATANDLKVLGGSNCVVHSKSGDIFYVGTDQKIHRLRQINGVWNHQLLGAYTNANSKTNGELALDESDNSSTITVYYRGIDNRLQAVWFNPNTGDYENTFIDQNWSNGDYLINSSRKGVLRYTGSLGAMYIGADNKLHRFYFANNTWNHELANYTYADGELIKGGLEWNDNNATLYYVGTNGRIQSFNRGIRFENGGFVSYWKHNLIDDYQDSPEYYGYRNAIGISGASILQIGTAGKKIIYNSEESIARIFEYKDCESPVNCEFPKKNLNRPAPQEEPGLLAQLGQGKDFTLQQKQQGSEGYALSPNPVAHVLHIRSDKNTTAFTVSVFNLNGKLILEKEDQHTRDVSLDLSGYSPGLYLIRIKDAYGQHTYKISKQ